METQYINLNMTPSGINPMFHISQYDIGRPLGVKVHNGSEVVDLDSYVCTIEATRNDGVAITANVSTNDNVGTFETTATMTNKADKYKAQFIIMDGNSKRIASLPFDMDVCKAAMDENSESIEEDASLYQQYTEAVQGAIAEANADIQAEASTRASADSNLQSQINQIVAPSGEAPSAAEVQNARIGADGVTYDTLGTAIRTQVNILNNELANVYFKPLNLGDLYTDGYYTVTKGVLKKEQQSSDRGYFKLKIKPNYVYKILGYNYYGVKSFIVVDSEYNLLDYDKSDYTYDDKLHKSVSSIFTPGNASYLILPYHTIGKYIADTSYKIQNTLTIVLEACPNKNSETTFENRFLVKINTGGYPSLLQSTGYTTKLFYVTKTDSIYVRTSEIYSVLGFTILDMNMNIINSSYNQTYFDTEQLNDYLIQPNKDCILLISYRNGENITLANIIEQDFNNIRQIECIGDSFTDSATLNGKPNYVDFLKAKFNCNVLNDGHAGTGFWNYFGDNAFYNVAKKISSDSDIITVFGSFNDLATDKHVVLGNVTDTDTTTLAGCMANTILNIRNANTNCLILFVAPTPWKTNNSVTGKAEWASINPYDYVDMMKKVCEKYNVPFINGYTQSNIYPWNDTFVKKYQIDSTHPNSLAHYKFIFPMFKNGILKLVS